MNEPQSTLAEQLRAQLDAHGVDASLDDVVQWARDRADALVDRGVDDDLQALLEGRSVSGAGARGSTFVGVPQPAGAPQGATVRPELPQVRGASTLPAGDDLELLDDDDLELVEDVEDDAANDGEPLTALAVDADDSDQPEWKRALADAQGD